MRLRDRRPADCQTSSLWYPKSLNISTTVLPGVLETRCASGVYSSPTSTTLLYKLRVQSDFCLSYKLARIISNAHTATAHAATNHLPFRPFPSFLRRTHHLSAQPSLP